MARTKSAPVPAPKPLQAVTALIVESGWIVGLATENEAGYSPLNYGPFKTEAEARKLADDINEKAYGLSPKRALMVVLSSMFPAPPVDHARRRATWPE